MGMITINSKKRAIRLFSKTNTNNNQLCVVYSFDYSSSGENGASPTGTGPVGGSSTQLDVQLGASSQWTVAETAATTSPTPAPLDPLRVAMLGAAGVGKTALTAQFMTSEYLNTYEASLGETHVTLSFCYWI